MATRAAAGAGTGAGRPRAWRLVRAGALAAGSLLTPVAAAMAQPAHPQAETCSAAIAVVEQETGLPPGLLGAIARVESGRGDPRTGAVVAWPWTINAEGVGSSFPTRDHAVAAVQALQSAGRGSIDVGCMQVNLRHHPQAFSSAREAFEPLANVRYAARFLAALRETSGSWPVAIGRYHSSTAGLAEGYRQRVLSLWTGERPATRPSPEEARRDEVRLAWQAAGGEGGRRNAPPPPRPSAFDDPVAAVAAAWASSSRRPETRRGGAVAMDARPTAPEAPGQFRQSMR